MNVKLGMPIWSVPRIPTISERTMIIGIDIYHKLISENRSCMGFVASLDPNFSSYFSQVLLMKKGQEMAYDLASRVELAI